MDSATISRAGVMRPPRFAKRPRPPYALNRDCPQAEGLVGFWPIWWEISSTSNYCHNLCSNGAVGSVAGGTTAADRMSVSGPPSTSLLMTDFGPTALGGTGPERYFSATSPWLTAPPMTMAIWGRLNQTTVLGSGMALSQHNDTDPIIAIQATSSGTVRAIHTDNVGTSGSAAGGTYAIGETFHLLGTFGGLSDRSVYKNGVFIANNTTTVAAHSGLTRSGIGATIRTSVVDEWSGQFCHACLWNRVITTNVIRQCYDLPTRWDLYYPLGMRIFSFGETAAVAFDKPPSPTLVNFAPIRAAFY